MPNLTKADMGRFGGPTHVTTATGTTPVTVQNRGVTQYSQIDFTVVTPSGSGPTVQPVVTSKVIGTSFTYIAGSGDTSLYAYRIR